MSVAEILVGQDELVMDFTAIWNEVRVKLRESYGEATYKSWLGKLSFVSSGGGQVLLGAPTKFLRDWIFANFGGKILRVWQEFDSSVYSIDIIVSANAKPEAPISVRDIIQEDQVSENLLTAKLDPRYTFDNFVVGKSNEFAYAAARSVAESDIAQAESNPLFLYGGVGLGKTHLMHAIAWHIRSTNPSRKVMYLSAEKFMYQFVMALRNKDIMNFKELFRSADVLMIDDVQFICGKDSTQEEFFHTFNTLFDNNRQVVISADRSPSDLNGMEDRIKSRLGWGLVADVHSTTYELRLGILQAKTEQLKAKVPKNVLEFLAAKITSNVRELEGSLNKIIAHSNLVGRETTLENTQEILKDLLRSNEKMVTIEDIQKKVSEHFNIKLSDMFSGRRVRSLARPRQAAMYLCKLLTSRSLAEIGKKFGGKDHTTVIHAVKTIEELKLKDSEIKEDIELLIKVLQG